MARKLPARVSREEIESDGMLGLVLAAESWESDHPSGTSFASYAFGRIRWKILNEARRRRNHELPRVSDGVAEGGEDVADVPLQRDASDITERLPSLLDGLTERERAIVELRYMNGYRSDRIALQFGVTRQRVAQILQRALGKLRTAAGSGGGQ